MLNARKTHPNIFWPVLCYAAGLCVFLLLHLGLFATNRMMHAGGTLAPAAFSAEDFDLKEMLETDDGLVTTGSDPQMLLREAELRVESVWVEVAYSEAPWMATAFWAAEGEGYSLRRMVHGQKEDGGLRFWLPATGVQGLRLDLDTKAGNVLDITRVQVNRQRPFWAFFVPSAGEAVALAAGPGLVACALMCLRRLVAGQNGKAGEGRG